jgi:hypothetical protein
MGAAESANPNEASRRVETTLPEERNHERKFIKFSKTAQTIAAKVSQGAQVSF